MVFSLCRNLRHGRTERRFAWPTIANVNVNSWLKQAGDAPFVYTVKVPELITHIERFEGTAGLVEDFDYVADLLGPRMGCFLYQLPPSYTYSRERLDTILKQLVAQLAQCRRIPPCVVVERRRLCRVSRRRRHFLRLLGARSAG